MSGKNILVLTVLMISGITSIQARVILDFGVPLLDVTLMTGKWYLVASSNAENNDVCLSTIVEQNSDNKFILYLTSVLKPDIEENVTDLSEKVYNLTINCRMYSFFMTANVEKIMSNGVTRSDSTSALAIATILDGLNNIYLALYAIEGTAQVINGSDKLLFLFGRKKTMTDESLEAVKTFDYIIFGDSLKTLRILNSTECQ